MTKEERVCKKNQMNIQVQGMKLLDVVLVREGGGVETLGPMK
jgi:hypothetical protein